MSFTWDEQSRKRVLGRIAQHLHDEGAKDLDGFSSGLISKIGEHVAKQGEFPHELELKAVMRSIKTSLVRENYHLRNKELTSWLAGLLAAEGQSSIRPISILAKGGLASQVSRISIDDIGSFQEVRKVSFHEVQGLVPLKIPETEIKQNIAQIIGEPFVPKDWGGEIADLFSTHLTYQGKRLASGFLLKGPGVKQHTLTINHLGKNGDQVVRLTSTSLDLYVVQFVGPIAPAVVDHLEAHVRQAAGKAGQTRYYCVIDGTDTARLFKAYGKL
jgi:hypothetical protein